MRKIVLDPGHGGRDPGCHGNGLIEKEVNLDMARRVGHLLRAQDLATVCTREEDTFVAIPERARIARESGAFALISFHADWSSSPTAHGLTAYVVESDSRSRKLAEALLESAHTRSGRLISINGVLPDTRTHVGRLGVLRGTCHIMPAVLIECGFLSCSRDASLLADSRFREDLATGIASALIAAFMIFAASVV